MRVHFTVLAAAVTLIASTDASLAYTDSDQTKLSKIVSDFGIHSIESHQIEEKRFLRTHVDTSEEEDEDKNNEERAGALNKLDDLMAKNKMFDDLYREWNIAGHSLSELGKMVVKYKDFPKEHAMLNRFHKRYIKKFHTVPKHGGNGRK